MYNSKKRPYEALSLEVSRVETENTFAAGSATVIPVDSNQRVLEEWDEDPTDTRIINWE